MTDRQLRFGVSGLGRGFMLMLPTLITHPRASLVAATDPRAEARARFETDFKGRAYDDFQGLCEDPNVEVIYIASPHQFHAEQVVAAARARKHVLVEKPMALSVADCSRMTTAARASDVRLIVGPSHGFDAPVALARRLIESGDHGAVRMITALNYTDFVYRPRRPEELDATQGGGVVFGQAAHQIDVVRALAGARVRSVRAQVGDWDARRPTEGAYTAFLTFERGIVAALTYSGYAFFDSDELCGWIGETGFPRSADDYGEARKRLPALTESEAALKEVRRYGPAQIGTKAPSPPFHEHFGFIVVSCERADLRVLPHGVMIHGERERTLVSVPAPSVPRAEVIDEVYEAIVNGKPPLHDGDWGTATLAACIAIRQSSAEDREIILG
ncbi:MAG: Gfo/Idh/MocA family oxidoreductase [Gammaproteobacteria bacterium]